MTYRTGDVRSGSWELIRDDSLWGIFCGEGADLHGCGVRYLPGGVYYEGELQQGQPASGNLIFPNRSLSSGDPAQRNAWDLLMDMQYFHGSFSGSWSCDGYPEQGTYTFSSGRTLSGSFAYARNEEYTGMLQNGKACAIGAHPLMAHMIRRGEFLNGRCSGLATVQHDCGACFHGRWDNGEIVEGVLRFTDGTEKLSRNWSLSETRLSSGNILSGIFCDHHKQACGIGKVTFLPQKTEFCGEIQNNECKSGIYTDSDGNIL